MKRLSCLTFVLGAILGIASGAMSVSEQAPIRDVFYWPALICMVGSVLLLILSEDKK